MTQSDFDRLAATNMFYALVRARWGSGEDGEHIARQLAEALFAIMAEEGITDPATEFVRLAKGA
jgi:hypothetical protein